MTKGYDGNFRIERDSMGEVRVPKGAYFGAQTQRAAENFPISDLVFPRAFVRALGLVKWPSARANRELGLLEANLARAIQEASQEVIEGKWDDQFVVDISQTWSGTSTNMNANEVIANRPMNYRVGHSGLNPGSSQRSCQSLSIKQ